jgi:LacI family transcriptional regulator
VAKEAIPFLTLFRPRDHRHAETWARAGDVLAAAAIRAIREPEAPPLQDLEVPQDDAPAEAPGIDNGDHTT